MKKSFFSLFLLLILTTTIFILGCGGTATSPTTDTQTKSSSSFLLCEGVVSDQSSKVKIPEADGLIERLDHVSADAVGLREEKFSLDDNAEIITNTTKETIIILTKPGDKAKFKTGQDGSFQFRVLPGAYKLTFSKTNYDMPVCML